MHPTLTPEAQRLLLDALRRMERALSRLEIVVDGTAR